MNCIGIPRWHSSLAFLALALSSGLPAAIGQTATPTATVNSPGAITGASSTPSSSPANLGLTPNVSINNPRSTTQDFVIRTEWRVDGVVKAEANTVVQVPPGETKTETPRQDKPVPVGEKGEHEVIAYTTVIWGGMFIVQHDWMPSAPKKVTSFDVGDDDGVIIAPN